MSAENLGEVTAGAVQCKQSGLDFAFSILAIPAILAILAISSLSLLCNTSRNPFWFQGF